MTDLFQGSCCTVESNQIAVCLIVAVSQVFEKNLSLAAFKSCHLACSSHDHLESH